VRCASSLSASAEADSHALVIPSVSVSTIRCTSAAASIVATVAEWIRCS
jgi:hypothetical protein